MQIEKGVPLPTSKSGRAKYSLAEMEPGDSFFVDTTQPDVLNNLAAAISYFGTRNNRKYARRKVDGGHRVWRLA